MDTSHVLCIISVKGLEFDMIVNVHDIQREQPLPHQMHSEQLYQLLSSEFIHKVTMKRGQQSHMKRGQ